MPHIVLTDVSVSINGVDLSEHVKDIDLKYSAEVLDDTAMGQTAKGKKSGLKDANFDVNFYQDFGAGEVDATLFPLVGGEAVPIIIKPKSDAVSATNPSYTGNAICTSYPPLSGAHGQMAMTKAHFEVDKLLNRSTE